MWLEWKEREGWKEGGAQLYVRLEKQALGLHRVRTRAY